MHLSCGVIVAACLGLVASHGSHQEGFPVPNIMAGRRALEDSRLHRREVMARRAAAPEPQPERLGIPALQDRQSVSRCGTGFETVCDPGYCCSSAGWCGQGYLYCSAPSCQIDYGPGCDANIRPDGPDTTNIARPHIGPVPYGEAVYHCEEYGDIALTYDDGPYLYTEDLLNKLAVYNAKATFYITGNNLGKGKINDPSTPWPALIRRMIAEGHQVASHTWSHQRLTLVSEEKFRNQIIYNEIAFADLLGYFPTYMRPPYSACNSTCEGFLNELGYHITYFNLDTEGYLHDSPDTIQISKDIWNDNVEGHNPTNTKWLGIEHDPVYQSVYNLTDHMLESLFRNGFRAVTVGECLGDPKQNWYRSVGPVPPSSSTRTSTRTSSSTVRSSTSSVPSPTGSLPPSTNGRCGPNFGFQTCISEPGATCCSPAGWCGNTVDHCGTGCQPLYGNCQVSSPASSIRSSSSSTRSSSSTPPSSSSTRPSSSSTRPSSSSVSSSRTSTVPSSTRTTSSVASPTGTPPASTDGRCGPNFGGTSCLFEPGATCCSPAGWCGNTADHCGTGCQPFYGNCQISPPRSSSTSRAGSSSSSRPVSSSSTSPSSSRTSSATSSSSRASSATSSSSRTSSAATSTATSKPPSTNGRCGINFGGTTCIKEPGATCCSPYGWCGATTAHCGANCQPDYGTCGSSL